MCWGEELKSGEKRNQALRRSRSRSILWSHRYSEIRISRALILVCLRATCRMLFRIIRIGREVPFLRVPGTSTDTQHLHDLEPVVIPVRCALLLEIVLDLVE